jgi:hypothetical protein
VHEHVPEAADDAVDGRVGKIEILGVQHTELDVPDPELRCPSPSDLDHGRAPVARDDPPFGADEPRNFQAGLARPGGELEHRVARLRPELVEEPLAHRRGHLLDSLPCARPPLGHHLPGLVALATRLVELHGCIVWMRASRRPPPPRPRAGASEVRAKAADVLRPRYRAALRATVSASAAPYGYTLTIWTSGAILSHAHGIPSSAQALFFLIGAVAGYALVAGIAFRGGSDPLSPEPIRAAIWGALHLFSVGLAIGCATIIAHGVSGSAAWPLGGFTATALYLLASASQLAVVHTSRGSP